MMAFREGTRAPGPRRPEWILDRRSSRTRRYTGSVVVPMTKPLSPRWAVLVSQRAFCGDLRQGALAAALLEQQVVSVGRPGVQDLVLPVGTWPHQLFAVRHPGGLE